MDFLCFYFPLFCIHWLMGDHLLVIFMEGADVFEETLMKKAGELMLVAKDNLP